jgi:hypothetical protein
MGRCKARELVASARADRICVGGDLCE